MGRSTPCRCRRSPRRRLRCENPIKTVPYPARLAADIAGSRPLHHAHERLSGLQVATGPNCAMATFTLPKNSKISGKGRAHKAEGAGRVKSFKIYRYDPDSPM